jgi:hypothetical protein
MIISNYCYFSLLIHVIWRDSWAYECPFIAGYSCSEGRFSAFKQLLTPWNTEVTMPCAIWCSSVCSCYWEFRKGKYWVKFSHYSFCL